MGLEIHMTNTLREMMFRSVWLREEGKDAADNFDLTLFNVPQKYPSPIQLSPEKLGNLRILISEWVPRAVKRIYWDRVFAVQGLESGDPTIPSIEPVNTDDPTDIPGSSANEGQDDHEDDLSIDDKIDISLAPEEPLLYCSI